MDGYRVFRGGGRFARCLGGLVGAGVSNQADGGRSVPFVWAPDGPVDDGCVDALDASDVVFVAGSGRGLAARRCDLHAAREGLPPVWVVLGLDGDVLESFPPTKAGWRLAVRWAERQGGELDVVFMAYASPAA